MDETENTNETEETTPEVASIEVPQPVADLTGSYSDLEETAAASLLDTLFGEDIADGEVAGIRDDIAAEIMLLNSERTPENVERMALLGRYLDVAEAEMARRQEAQNELNAKADAIASRFESEDDVEMQEGAPDEEDDEEDMTASEETEEGPVEEATVVEPAVEAPAGLAVRPRGSGLAAQLSQRTSRHDSQRVVSAQPSIAATVMHDARPPAEAVEEMTNRLLGSIDADAKMKATSAARTTWADFEEGAPLSMSKLGEIFWGKRKTLHNRMGSGVKDDRISLAQATLDWDDERYLTDDAVRNFGIFQSLKSDVETIVASGGSCAPAAPRYDIFRTAMPQSPVEDNLPVLGAPRGSIRFVTPPDFTDMRSGVGVTTDAEDAAGYGSGSGEATPKPCVHVDCAPIQECTVSTVSQCIEFGNLTFETFPEFVAARLADLAVNFASVKEVFYLDAIDAASCTSTYAAAYGVSRSLPHHVWQAAHNYRKRNNMDIDATLDWYAPDWAAVAHAIDKRNDFSEGANQMPTLASVTSEYQAIGLNVVWYYDSATGEGQAFATACTDGAAGGAFPTTATWYLHAPGTFVRLDAGTLDLGIVRDSTLNRTNDLQIFAEQWVQVCQLGIEGIKGQSTGLCPSGGAPAAATLLTC
jgi:hypothetical protein